MALAYLIDTQALLWAADDADRLGSEAVSILADPLNSVYISMGSLWEISIKASIGKLEIPESFFGQVFASGYLKLSLEVEHLQRYRELPLHHRDPFDRLLVAQAQVEGLRIISDDSALSGYEVETIW
ncbi:MAG TPA: type II toxin-antitoxin system VapC family toxin [Gammaproteobacteria bacterium]